MIENKCPLNVLACIVFIVFGIGPAIFGCSERSIPIQQAVFFDIDAKQAVAFPAVTQYPAIHPVTGKASLMPAMYCSNCSVWRQVPLPEQINRTKQTITCVKCKSKLEIQGPFPQ